MISHQPSQTAAASKTSRYANMFAALQSRGEGALGAFLMLGDPDPPTSALLLDALVEGGADMIEVGIPFSDPIADGPVIQAAARRALQAGVTPNDCFQLLADFRVRHPDIPVGILTYANIVAARGIDQFYRSAAEAAVDSVLVADAPAIEAIPFVDAALQANIDPVLIAAPNTPMDTLRKIGRLGRGYTYCVSRSGVTGATGELSLQHGGMIAALAAAGAPPPVMGFGISRPEHVRAALEEGAAGVIVGTALVRLVKCSGIDTAEEEIRETVRALKAATL